MVAVMGIKILGIQFHYQAMLWSWSRSRKEPELFAGAGAGAGIVKFQPRLRVRLK
jgi:hypothetical protein